MMKYLGICNIKNMGFETRYKRVKIGLLSQFVWKIVPKVGCSIVERPLACSFQSDTWNYKKGCNLQISMFVTVDTPGAFQRYMKALTH